MADVRDYLELRGDITLSERPFNDVDNLVLATAAYLDFTGIAPAPDKGSLRVGDACAELLARSGGDVSSRVRSLATIDERFVAALGGSARFGNARLRDYVDVRSDELVMQFSAMTFDLAPELTYVAFRGTDTTLVGWRENFALSFTVSMAQHAAAAYLARELERAQESGARVLVGGHSKGGNLAAFAVASCPVALADKIACVWSNDGPGMDPSVMAVSCYDVVGERYRRIIPAYSVVGRLFSDNAPCQVVTSSATRTLQHDPLTWQVGPAGLLDADGADPECLVVSEAFSSWLATLAPQDRRLLTDELFDALAAGGAERFEDVFSTPAATREVLAALGGVDARTREMVWGLARELVSGTAAATWEAVARKLGARD